MGALYLEDSLRPKTQRFLIRSVNLDDEGHFLRKFTVPVPAPIEGKDKKSVDFARTFHSSEIGQRNVLTSREPSGSMCKENNILNGIENFAKLTVTQVFDSLSPYKYEINRRVSTAFEKDENCNENNDKSDDKSNEKGIEKNNGREKDTIEDRELDEELIIHTTGLTLSLDANAVKHVHIILEPVIEHLLASPINRNPRQRPQARVNSYLQSPKGNNQEDVSLSECFKLVRLYEVS